MIPCGFLYAHWIARYEGLEKASKSGKQLAIYVRRCKSNRAAAAFRCEEVLQRTFVVVCHPFRFESTEVWTRFKSLFLGELCGKGERGKDEGRGDRTPDRWVWNPALYHWAIPPTGVKAKKYISHYILILQHRQQRQHTLHTHHNTSDTPQTYNTNPPPKRRTILSHRLSFLVRSCRADCCLIRDKEREKEDQVVEQQMVHNGPRWRWMCVLVEGCQVWVVILGCLVCRLYPLCESAMLSECLAFFWVVEWW